MASVEMTKKAETSLNDRKNKWKSSIPGCPGVYNCHMKKLFVVFGLVLFSSVGAAFAQTDFITLYDQVLSVPGCTKANGAKSCAVLDGTSQSNLQKKVSITRFVPGSGYLAVYFQDKRPSGGGQGGFTFDQVFYEPNSGGRILLGSGMQIFERGNLVVEYDQPSTDTERLAIEHEFVFYYLPHTESQRQSFLFQLQDDPAKFADYKEQQKRDVAALCAALKGVSRLPSVCPEPTTTSGTTSGSTTGGFTSRPQDLPELDFSGKPTRKPIAVVHENERLVFVGEPVTIPVDELSDPDGKCQFFQFQWQRASDLQVTDASVDPRLGDLFFVPANTGSFTVTLRVKEFCQELGTLTSDPVPVRVVVNDKATAFPDLDDAPQYRNAIYDLYHLGVMKGYPDGTMRPNSPINRAEFLKILFETLLYRLDKTAYSPRYPDVLPTDWFAPYLFTADTLGVTKGYPDGMFHPERTVNLVEALKMAMHFTTIEIMDADVYSFLDISNEDWYSRYVQTAFREGILDDIQPGGYVRPGQFLTRGKAALIVVRTLLFPVNRINQTNKDVLRKPEEFQDFSSFNY